MRKMEAWVSSKALWRTRGSTSNYHQIISKCHCSKTNLFMPTQKRLGNKFNDFFNWSAWVVLFILILSLTSKLLKLFFFSFLWNTKYKEFVWCPSYCIANSPSKRLKTSTNCITVHLSNHIGASHLWQCIIHTVDIYIMISDKTRVGTRPT